MNKVRIIGGAWRSRLVAFPDAPGLRPTADRVRVTLFNWLGQDLTGKICLDLFAGSGVLGFEALSRNARFVVMVERDAKVRAGLTQSAAALDTKGRLELIGADALQFLLQRSDGDNSNNQRFDVVFCDPPFREGWFGKLWDPLAGVVRPGGVVYAESETALAPPAPWRVKKSGKAGAVHYHLITLEE